MNTNSDKERADPEQGTKAASKRKDRWDKADVILKPLGGFLTASVIALLGFWTQNYLRDKAEQDTKVRLYNQLLSEREQSESQLRSAMFSKIIDSFVGAGEQPDPENQILYLELLVRNFHESLNLEPLFSHLQRQLHAANPKNDELSNRLSDLAREVGRKQLLALATHGDMHENTFYFEKRKLPDGNYKIFVTDTDLSTDGVPEGCSADSKCIAYMKIGRGGDRLEEPVPVRLFFEDVDLGNMRIKIREETGDSLLVGQSPPEFWLDYFDFPMIDNTRLSSGNRLAVVLSDFDATMENEIVEGAARVSVVLFPEEYSSLKDRTFLQDILNDLAPSGDRS